MSVCLHCGSEVRIEQCLHTKEDKFVVERKKTVFQPAETQDTLQRTKSHGGFAGITGSAQKSGSSGLHPLSAKLKKYYYGKDYFSLTDVWAVMAVTTYIDEHKLSEQRDQHSKDPFPIYTVIDKQCKQCKDNKGLCWCVSERIKIPGLRSVHMKQVIPSLEHLSDVKFSIGLSVCLFCGQCSGEVRIGHSLHTNEEEFVIKRRETVFQSLQELEIHCSQNEVPHIALLGSGGGQRAMVGLLGSLVELDKAGLLDCILYLSGVSGSTWCMASLYQEPDWSTKLDTVKDKIIKRLSGPEVSWGDAYAKLKKYHKKDNFSLTDVWAVMVITEYVKEIDEQKLTDQWDQLSKDPFPIYAAIDKQCKQKEDGDPWFEISPHEAGYSLTGAFVETSSFCSQFDNGSKKKEQPEMDMLYLQALCGSALADEDEIFTFFWEKIKGADAFQDSVLLKFEKFFPHLIPIKKKKTLERMSEDPKDPPEEMYYQVLMDLVDMNLSVLNGKDPSDLDQSIRKSLNDLFLSICTCMAKWIWGRNYNFLHKMRDEAVPAALLESNMRDYEDAGLLLNSPYFSVLREERHIDLIISLDFSDGDPFMTVRETAEMCKKLNIPFPEVNIPREDLKKPKDFYVFKGQNAPTVIHIPLFNVVNYDVETWRNKYATFQRAYSAEMITDLMEIAGKNILNNREKLLEQIRAVVG
ncbi:Cytosolic phospholipase A2 gamma [Labeo rohita]|uniref:Cytosolic phospholipase A2 gamma n=1 Tax=Labeo rohita TaxID=84645 RepID=A0ABQ8L7P2_LABRO|nr:Cytosolic phospholipase A2 gamma [Labeo rohita]